MEHCIWRRIAIAFRFCTLKTLAVKVSPLKTDSFMTKRGSKTSKSNDFADALKAWELDHPDAWDRTRANDTSASKTPEGPLAQAMRKQLKKLQDTAPAKASAQPRAGTPSAQTATPPDSATKRRLTEKALMREAFEALEVDTFDPTAKFRGQGYAEAMNVEIIDETPAPPPISRSASEAVRHSYNSEDRAFEEFMMDADVQPLSGPIDKLRDAVGERSAWERRSRAQEAAWREQPTTDELHAPQLTTAQRKLLKRAKKYGHIPELNLRHYRKHEALNTLYQFVRAQQMLGIRYVKIITGKGKRSQEQVVIKPAVLDWCQIPQNAEMLLDYSLAPDESGDYGVVIFELRRP